MKEYVLDTPSALELAAAPAAPAAGYVPPIAPSSWPSLMWLLILEPVALALLYVALIGFPGSSQASLDNAPVYVAAFSFPKGAEAQAGRSEEPVVPENSITHQRGRYVVELHAAPVSSALAMLSQVTGATVTGGNALAGNGALITRVFETSSPVEAWQAVFGGVANFAIACNKGACAVRFVAPADPAAPRAVSEAVMAVSEPPPPPTPGAADNVEN
jgi:hypothetical protein